MNTIYHKEKNKSILITMINFSGYSGSELHFTSLLRELVTNGYDVTLAVFFCSYPLKQVADELGVNVIKVYFEPLPQKHYDIFIAQHFAVADYVVVTNEFTFDRLWISILGAKDVNESLPVYANTADIITFVSDEAREIRLSQGLDIDINKTHILVNYADAQFFNAYRLPKNNRVSKIAIISNHICDELLEFKAIAEKNNLVVDCFGRQFVSVKVDSQLIDKYDVVITIGKTAQYCLAEGVPIYCYDIFGGSGYVTADNFEINLMNNFSGRDYPIHKTAKELFDDILNMYGKAVNDIPFLYNKACEHFNISILCTEILHKLLSTNTNTRSLYNYFKPYQKDRIIATTTSMLGNDWYYRGCSCFVFNYGNGFVEEGIVNFPIVYDSEIELSVDIPKDVTKVRFDPDYQSCICKIIDVKCDNQNTIIEVAPISLVIQSDGIQTFLDNDPQYLVTLSGNTVKKLYIKFRVKQLKKSHSEIILNDIINQTKNQLQIVSQNLEANQCEVSLLQNEANVLQHQVNLLQNDIQAISENLDENTHELYQKNSEVQRLQNVIQVILNSRSWKLIQKIKKILYIFRR